MSLTVDQALRDAAARLRGGGVADPLNDARHLVAHALGVARDRLILMGADPMPAAAVLRLAPLLDRRIAHEPVTRIIGQRLFWGRAFAVTPDVLDPRPDTETLIAAALEVGTGSGAIAVTLLAEWPGARGLATDISTAALAVARDNARRHGVQDRLDLILSDWFADVRAPVDLILSNPPYIAADEMPALDPEVLLHDPAIALSPGGDGLAPYRVIAAQAGAHLTPGGRVIVECGWQQGDAVQAIFRAAGWRQPDLRRDLEGRDRVIIARMAD